MHSILKSPTAYTGCVNESGDLAVVFFPGLIRVEGMLLLLPSSLLRSVLVAMEPWTGAECAFAVKAFYKNGDSFVIAQREFRRGFGIHRNRAVPSVHAFKTWVQNFEATGSTLKHKNNTYTRELSDKYVRLIYVGRDNGRSSLIATVRLFCGPGREYMTQSVVSLQTELPVRFPVPFLYVKEQPFQTAIFEWNSRFKAGRVSVEDAERSRRPSIRKEKKRRIHALADTVGISHGVCQERPDLDLCDFALFPKLKMNLKGRGFETVSDIRTEPQAALDSIKATDFHSAFEERSDRCKLSQRDCFEGDGSQN
ncbi:hypothetical protein B7P43_G09049 [Cryptotermes secundus]|uniref:DUF4817 domain-containing protein n=1 Tax=Cryptotermes secundus TaxID=105785 RepID=A0A2J7PHP7_9NEOP|nr:hypothetical protein B7P43_G09049 [Cryptotermes secundus]